MSRGHKRRPPGETRARYEEICAEWEELQASDDDESLDDEDIQFLLETCGRLLNDISQMSAKNQLLSKKLNALLDKLVAV